MSTHEPLPTFPGNGGDGASRNELLTDGGYASWLVRVGAYLIDGLLLFAATYVIARLLGVHSLTHLAKKQSTEVSRAIEEFSIIDYALVFLYATVLLTSRWSATLGMRLSGIRLETVDGSKATLARVAGRMAIVLAASLLALAGPLGIVVFLAVVVDLLWPLWDERRQTLHDKLAGTVVKRGRAT